MVVLRVRIQQDVTDTSPGLSGTSSSTVVSAEDAAPDSGGRATAGESVDPAVRPGNTGVDNMLLGRMKQVTSLEETLKLSR